MSVNSAISRTASASFAGGDKKGVRVYHGPTMYTKLIKWFAQTRVGGWMFLNVFDRIDKPLMRLTNARLERDPAELHRRQVRSRA